MPRRVQKPISSVVPPKQKSTCGLFSTEYSKTKRKVVKVIEVNCGTNFRVVVLN